MSDNSIIPKIDLDLPQWKRDIQTFIDSTLNELSEISDQLSAEFADPNLSNRRVAERGLEERVVDRGGNDRLAKLKEKLAQKVK